MQPRDAREIGLELCKSALGACDYRGARNAGIRAQHIVERLPLARLIHEQAKLFLHCNVQRACEIARPADLRDNPASGLLRGLFGDALPALKLLFGLIRPCDAAVGIEKQNLLRAGLNGFLNDIIRLVALRQAAQHRHLHARLRGAADDLDHLGLDLLLIGLHETAFIIRPLSVADYHILAGAQPQHAHMLRVAPFHYCHAAQNVCTGHKKSRHTKIPVSHFLLVSVSKSRHGFVN